MVVLAGCGSSSDSSENVITAPPAAPQDGISGQVASSVSGGRISVADANGNDVVVATGRTTDTNGSFNLVFSEFAIEDGITPPLLVTVDGEGATAICDFDGPGDSDCVSADGSSVPFGTRYDLPAGFTLSGITASYNVSNSTGFRTATVNLSAASDLATHYAVANTGAAPLTTEAVLLAEQQALGVVEFLTGLTVDNMMLNNVTVPDLTASQVQTNAALALGLFNAGIHGLVDTSLNGQRNYRLALNRLQSQIRPTGNGNELSATGSYLAQAAAAPLTGATSYQASLALPSPALAGAVASQTSAITLLTAAGNSPVRIALPADPLSDAPLDRAKTLTSSLAEVMGAAIIITDTERFGATTSGAADMFEQQLNLISTLADNDLRRTLLQLDAAITQAQATQQTQLTGAGVSGVIDVNGNTVTIATATSTSSNIQNGVSVNITLTDATRENPGGNGLLTAGEIAINVSQTFNNLTTQQIYSGSLTLEMVAANGSTDVDRLDYNGNLRAASAQEFSGDISITGLSPLNTVPLAGSFDSQFVFSNDIYLNLVGQLASQINHHVMTAGTTTVMTDTQTNTVTDMNAELNLILDTDGQVTGGVINTGESTADQTNAASLDESGIVTFSDGTSRILPLPVN